VFIPATSTILAPLSRLGTSAACGTSSNLIASYVVPVRQYKHRSLAYFSAWITPNHLATCLAYRHDPAHTGLSPFGTLNFMSYIHHSRHTQCIKIIAEIVVNMDIVARIKFSSKLKVSTSAVGYYSYVCREQ